MKPTLYRGSVKDVKGPVRASTPRGERDGVVFDYTDAYSVFDWGRMPDLLARKGEALASLAASLFERIERPDTWVQFSKTPIALALRKGNRFGAAFNELGEQLQKSGMRTHYQGLLADGKAGPAADAREPSRELFVEQVAVVKPAMVSILGRELPDYSPTRSAPAPRLVPLEVIFRFSCPAGSSLLDRAKDDPGYLASIGYGDLELKPGASWDFPVLEVFTKLESSDRPLSLGEGLAISGLAARQLEELLLKTAWLAGCLRWICSQTGLELADGKFEWALSADGTIFLVDAIGPDELRLLKDGVQLSKEFLRTHYRATPWYRRVVEAKKNAQAQGSAEWKKLVAEGPPTLPAAERELATQLYLSLANALSGRAWFPGAWPLEKVVAELGRKAP
ncbi:MAG TPA: phosphoribosylaminoimidazolesuccinocarboxamide synthase [Bdellovibrionota bacterium]|nr:phosphoribosylaminoimidazolesuccinocarboxamide synthase [Bdellovibrionota bacterium]